MVVVGVLHCLQRLKSQQHVAESCIHCAHISCGCCVNTAAIVLYKFLREAYDSCLVHASESEKSALVIGTNQKRHHYFLLIMKLLVLQFVRSAYSGNIEVHPELESCYQISIQIIVRDKTFRILSTIQCHYL